MALWAWLVYFIKGFLPFDGKRVGKILWLSFWIILALTVYHKLFQKQSITKIEKIETQIINECPEDKGVAEAKLKIWKFYIKFGL